MLISREWECDWTMCIWNKNIVFCKGMQQLSWHPQGFWYPRFPAKSASCDDVPLVWSMTSDSELEYPTFRDATVNFLSKHCEVSCTGVWHPRPCRKDPRGSAGPLGFTLSWRQPLLGAWDYFTIRPDGTGLILGLRPANERRRYCVATSLIGLAQT